MKKLYIILLLLSYLYVEANNKNSVFYFQNIGIDSIKQLENDSLKVSYLNEYINNAKDSKDNLKIVNGYLIMVDIFTHSEKAIKYSDTAIYYSKGLNKIDPIYPAKSYLKRGIQYYYLGKDNLALNDFLITDSLARKEKNNFQKLVVKHYIGLLKNNHSERENALRIFKENLIFFNEKENQIKYRKQYLKSVYALADSYLKNNLLDSADYYGRLGVRESKKTTNLYLHEFFLQQIGYTEYLRGNYKIALSYFLESPKYLKKKKAELASCYLMIGKTYNKLNNFDLSEGYFLKVDSLYTKHSECMFYAREAYTKLYLNDKTPENQIKIVNKILTIDSIIRKDYKNTAKNIIEKYDSKEYQIKKEKLIKKLNNQNKKLNLWVIFIIIILSIVIVVTIWFKIQNNKYKIRYKNLQYKLQNKKEKKIEKETETVKGNLGISQKIIDDILASLEEFERSEEFLSPDITASVLAKRIGTNTSYLSKVINFYRETNFSTYLKELRINYAIEKIQTDKTFRKYSVKAIAYEIGFKNVDSFSRAFYQITKIYPSFFIKQVNKEANVSDNL